MEKLRQKFRGMEIYAMATSGAAAATVGPRVMETPVALMTSSPSIFQLEAPATVVAVETPVQTTAVVTFATPCPPLQLAEPVAPAWWGPSTSGHSQDPSTSIDSGSWHSTPGYILVWEE